MGRQTSAIQKELTPVRCKNLFQRTNIYNYLVFTETKVYGRKWRILTYTSRKQKCSKQVGFAKQRTR